MKRGFTLLELLGVIIIIAVISSICVVAVNNYYKGAKEDSAIISAKNYIKSVNSLLVDVKGEYSFVDGKYNVNETTTIDSIQYRSINDYLEISDTKPSTGFVSVSDGVVTNAELKINKFTISFINNNYEIKSWE